MKKELISKKLKSALDELAQLELYNSHLYKHLANVCQKMGYFGAQKHFLKESAEEVEHYQKVVDFINDGGLLADIGSIESVNITAKTLGDLLEAAYNQEVVTEDKYSELASMCMGDDHVVYDFAIHVLQHQRKSVGEYGDLIARYETVKDNTSGILTIDKELGA
jgi:ferritin